MPELDKDGCIPLSNKEYAAFQQLAGFADALIDAESRLETRAKLVPGLWRDLRLLRVKGEKLCQEIFKTFPRNKREMIRHDWERMFAQITIKPGLNLPEQKLTGYATVPLQALEWLIQTVIDWECLTCMMESKEQKKCGLRAKLEQLYVFDLPDVQKGVCPFCTMACHEDMRRIGA